MKEIIDINVLHTIRKKQNLSLSLSDLPQLFGNKYIEHKHFIILLT